MDGMTERQASDIVVKMALDRDEKSKEGQALRIMLRELRARRGEAIELENAVNRMNGQIAGVVDEAS